MCVSVHEFYTHTVNDLIKLIPTSKYNTSYLINTSSVLVRMYFTPLSNKRPLPDRCPL